MKKLLLTLAVSSALGLTGCFASGEDADVTDADVNIPHARVAFDPGAGNVPIPSNILLAGTTDGTLNLPVDDPTDFSDPQNNLNVLDGWTTAMPFSFSFTLPEDPVTEEVIGINGTSAEAPGAVRVFKTVMGGAMDDPECAEVQQGLACRVEEELSHGEDFTVQFEDGEITVVPLRPLAPNMGYVVALKDSIADDLGRAVKPSSTYVLLSKPLEEEPIGGEQEQMLQAMINSHHAALGAAGVDQSRVIYSSGFSTQSVTEVMDVVRQMVLNPADQPQMGAQPTGMTAADMLIAAGQLPADPSNELVQVANAAQIYGGEVGLPYFSPVPTEDNPAAPLNDRWRASHVSPASILTALDQELMSPEDLVALGIDPEQLQNPASLAGALTYADAAGTPLVELDANQALTKFNPIPEVRSMEQVPLWMSVPDIDVVNAVRAAFELEPLEEPADGWPVVIFQHGITGSKENFLPIAGTLAAFGHAVVAIDHPLHGERGFEITDAEGGTVVINATDGEGGSPTDYLNLSSLLTARDNLRQSAADLMSLRVALNNAQIMDAAINPHDVKFVGHSLGAIAGTAFVSIANSPLPEEMQPLMPMIEVGAAALGMPGGGIAPFLLASESFGPLVGGQIAFESFPDFQEYVLQEATNSGVVPGSDEFMELLASSYVMYFEGGIATPAEIAERDALLDQFQFAAQSVVDSGDPLNYTRRAVATDTPIFLIQAEGDAVVPNTTPHPLGGTEPLVRELQLPWIGGPAQSQDGEPISAAANYVGAGHSSLLDPNDSGADEEVASDITMDMQMAIGLFFESNGMIINVNEALVD